MVEAVPPGASVSAAYLTLVNSSDKAARLIGGSSPLARRVTPMVTTRGAGGVVGMRAATLVVPARGTLVLGATGDHLMLGALPTRRRSARPCRSPSGFRRASI